MIKTFSLIRFVMVLCLAIVFHDSIYSQSVMHAKVEDGDGLPIPMAVVAVVSTDNQELSSSISDTNGVFELLLPREIEGTHVYIKAFGYNAVQMQTQEALSQTVFVLVRDWTELDGVTISADALSIERKPDRYAINNVYTSPLAPGHNTVEILRYVPLVNVTPEDELEILHKGKATIYIDGRPSHLDPKNIPAENIERIEVLTNPGSEFPSTVKNGILNIVLRKNPSDGVAATLIVKDRQRERWELNSPSLDAFVILQKKNVNATISFSTIYRPNYSRTESAYQYFTDNDTTMNTFQSSSRNRVLCENIHTMLEWHINEKHTLGLQVGTNISHCLLDSTSTRSDYYHGLENLSDSSDVTSSSQTFRKPNFSLFTNFNYNVKLNDKQLLTFDIFYTRSQNTSSYTNRNQRLPSHEMASYFTSSAAVVNGIDFKAKYSHKFSKNLSLRTGLECYGSVVDDDYTSNIEQSAAYMEGFSQSNHFVYRDITAALYAACDWEISDMWSLSAGLRGECYLYHGQQQVTKETISNKYLNLFPSFSLVFIPNDDHEFALDFASRQAIPSYGKRNPFKYYYSPTLYRENNIDLRPCRMYDAELTYTLFWDYVLVLGYSYSQNIWNEFRIATPETNCTKITDENYGNAHFFSIELETDQQLFKNYVFLSASIYYEYDLYRIKSPRITAFNAKGSEFSINLSISTALCKKKDWKLLTTLDYIPISSYVGANLNQSVNWNIHITKQFKNGTFSFGVDDILDWQSKESLATQNYIHSHYSYVYGRTYWVSYSLRLGNRETKGSQRRNSTIQERL